ncbi:MAG: hypothetical protein H7Z14_02125 [Anaerolineae bacterium]|nr:hypothetical protein [Phycisphaerae bacterium]
MSKHGLFGMMLAATIALGGCAMNHKHDHDDGDPEETPVTMDQLPAAVKATLAKEVGSGKVEEIDKDTENGRTIYEADVMLDGKKWEIKIGEDGQLIKKALDEEKDGEDEHNEKK